MMPSTTLKKKPMGAAAIKQQNKPKVTEEQSRDIMNNLFDKMLD
jgi:hypothetical protein